MSHIVDDEPPIKTHPANQAYRDNWDRIFGTKEPEKFDGPFCIGCGVGLEVDPKACCCEDCYRHDAACAKLCTEGAECDCGIG